VSSAFKFLGVRRLQRGDPATSSLHTV
jgi:hypothetical protein